MNTEYKYGDITEKVIGCAMKVYNTLGNGFQEIIYQRALAIEFKKGGLSFNEEFEISIFYENIQIGKRRVDFFIEGKVMLEIKAVSELEKVHITQGLNYLEASKVEVGLLINFGSTRLIFHRLMLKNKHQVNP